MSTVNLTDGREGGGGKKAYQTTARKPWSYFDKSSILLFFSVSDLEPDPDQIRIQSGQLIRIWNPDPDPGGQY